MNKLVSYRKYNFVYKCKIKSTFSPNIWNPPMFNMKALDGLVRLKSTWKSLLLQFYYQGDLNIKKQKYEKYATRKKCERNRKRKPDRNRETEKSQRHIIWKFLLSFFSSSPYKIHLIGRKWGILHFESYGIPKLIEYLVRRTWGVNEAYMRRTWGAKHFESRGIPKLSEYLMRRTWGVHEAYMRPTWGVHEAYMRPTWGVHEAYY